MKDDYTLGHDELWMVEHDKYGRWYFTSLYKAALFIKTNRAQLTYAFEHNRPYKGWHISMKFAGDVTWSHINSELTYDEQFAYCEPGESGEKALLKAALNLDTNK